MTARTLSLPPEWAPHQAVWVGWPYLRAEWGETFDAARTEIAAFITALALATPVKVACGSREAYGSAWLALEKDITAGRVVLHTVPAGDIWLRDTGPIFAVENGQPIGLQFQFNGWGGKFQMVGDTLTSGGLASAEQTPRRPHAFILEGGAIEWDGTGRLLTTRSCLLNPNRNTNWDISTASNALKQALNVHHIDWLETGLLNDHTDGHIDNLARFIGPGRVVCQHPSGSNDPNRERLLEIEKFLRAREYEVITLPSPGWVQDEQGTPLPASHMNFLISNRHIFLPVFEAETGAQAAEDLGAALPTFTIVPLSARNILSGGGAFHCMTQQVPA